MYVHRDQSSNVIGVFTNLQPGFAEEEVADDAPEVLAFLTPPVVIPALSPRQVRLVLNAAGLRSQVESAVAASDQNTKDMWQYATTFERTDPVLVAMATQIGITSAQLDQMFIEGSNL